MPSEDTDSRARGNVVKDNSGAVGGYDEGHFQGDEDDDHDSLESELINLDYTFRPIILASEREPIFLSPPEPDNRQKYNQLISSNERLRRQNMAGISDYNKGFPASGRVSAGYAIYDGDSGFQRSSASEGIFGYGGRSSSRNDNLEGNGFQGTGTGFSSPRLPYYGPGAGPSTTDQIDFSGAAFDRRTPTRQFSLPINTPPGSTASQPDSPEGGFSF